MSADADALAMQAQWNKAGINLLETFIKLLPIKLERSSLFYLLD